MKRFCRWLIGEDTLFSFEEKILHFALLLGFCMTVFGMIMDISYGGNVLIDALFTVFWLGAYYFAKYKGFFRVVSPFATGVLVFAFLPYNWIASGGSGGSLPFYTLLFVVVICIILEGRLRIVMVSATVLVVIFLIWYDYRFLRFAIDFSVNDMSFLDFTVHYLVVLTAMILLIFVYSRTYMNEKERREGYARDIAEQYRQQLYYMENLEQLIHNLKAERHDFNNHLGVIFGLLESGEPDKAETYARQLVDTAEEYQTFVNIPYPMLRALLNYKLSAAKGKKIELRLDIGIPEGLPLNELDLAVVFGNLLDNATEACVELDECRRYIALTIQYKPDYLIVHIENAAQKKDGFSGKRMKTTKPDRGNHGFGISNIRYLVNKHNGFIRISPEENRFAVDIAILINKETDG